MCAKWDVPYRKRVTQLLFETRHPEYSREKVKRSPWRTAKVKRTAPRLQTLDLDARRIWILVIACVCSLGHISPKLSTNGLDRSAGTAIGAVGPQKQCVAPNHKPLATREALGSRLHGPVVTCGFVPRGRT